MERDLAHLLDIVQAAAKIQQYIRDIDLAVFQQDEMRQDAVIHRLEVIGEATKRLSDDFRNKHPQIPWRLMARNRDFMIHNYDKIDLERIWETITVSIPELMQLLEPLLPPPEDEQN